MGISALRDPLYKSAGWQKPNQTKTEQNKKKPPPKQANKQKQKERGSCRRPHCRAPCLWWGTCTLTAIFSFLLSESPALPHCIISWTESIRDNLEEGTSIGRGCRVLGMQTTNLNLTLTLQGSRGLRHQQTSNLYVLSFISTLPHRPARIRRSGAGTGVPSDWPSSYEVLGGICFGCVVRECLRGDHM